MRLSTAATAQKIIDRINLRLAFSTLRSAARISLFKSAIVTCNCSKRSISCCVNSLMAVD